jgi:hypothetical protein
MHKLGSGPRLDLTRLLAVSALAVAGCWSLEPPLPGIGDCAGEAVNPGTYQITLAQVYGSTEATCGALDSIGPGSVLSMTITSKRKQFDCWTYQADVTLPTSIQTSGPAPNAIGGDHRTSLGVFVSAVAIGSCTGIFEIDLKERRTYGGADGAVETDFYVERYFLTQDAGSCPSVGMIGAFRCVDAWLATVTPSPI